MNNSVAHSRSDIVVGIIVGVLILSILSICIDCIVFILWNSALLFVLIAAKLCWLLLVVDFFDLPRETNQVLQLSCHLAIVFTTFLRLLCVFSTLRAFEFLGFALIFFMGRDDPMADLYKAKTRIFTLALSAFSRMRTRYNNIGRM